ncbi:MAG TPA: biopolymer transporter ExbD [Bacteroidetes bacterium]|nr:biopolymer transporter ExbD [Bacteroidota bacterium]
MAIETRNKIDSGFSMASMSDLVFLLLIFFMLTSTLVAPNAIKLLLPNSNSKTMAKQSLSVYINKERNFFIGDKPVAPAQLSVQLYSKIKPDAQATIVLRADKSVPIQDVVTVIDAINQLNAEHHTKYKMILATSPKK